MHVLDEAGRRGSRGSKQRFIPPRPWPHARAAAHPASSRPKTVCRHHPAQVGALAMPYSQPESHLCLSRACHGRLFKQSTHAPRPPLRPFKNSSTLVPPIPIPRSHECARLLASPWTRPRCKPSSVSDEFWNLVESAAMAAGAEALLWRQFFSSLFYPRRVLASP